MYAEVKVVEDRERARWKLRITFWTDEGERGAARPVPVFDTHGAVTESRWVADEMAAEATAALQTLGIEQREMPRPVIA